MSFNHADYLSFIRGQSRLTKGGRAIWNDQEVELVTKRKDKSWVIVPGMLYEGAKKCTVPEKELKPLSEKFNKKWIKHDMVPVELIPCRNRKQHHAVQIKWRCEKCSSCKGKPQDQQFQQVWVYDWTNTNDDMGLKYPLNLEIRDDWKVITDKKSKTPKEKKMKHMLKNLRMVHNNMPFSVFHEQIFPKDAAFGLCACKSEADPSKNCMMFVRLVCELLEVKPYGSKTYNILKHIFCAC